MDVYVVLHGERCEGGSVVSVHRTHAEAKKAALAVDTCFDGGWEEDGEDQWINGCDFVEIDVQKVVK